jgi:hypothetical protein
MADIRRLELLAEPYGGVPVGCVVLAAQHVEGLRRMLGAHTVKYVPLLLGRFRLEEAAFAANTLH